MVIGETVSEETYLACIEAIRAHEHPDETCPRLGVTRKQWAEMGLLAFGGDGFNHHLYQIVSPRPE
jgi:hypothetical protein